MGDSADAGAIYSLLGLVDRVAGDDAAFRRRVESLSPAERSLVAQEVVGYANDIENDAMGRYLIKEAIRRALPSV
jgi:hypothetical protein